ncbi:hypothetical protein M406DRAFT_358650 [Cryphonectria parasitica EP155]|uniref:BHLH domain-containing protein n=1 Tax=Cryphonectria parasitica (strain ATCC 38755 / EP155) TaxID=660469 RepID=A0A9P5CHD8_CRYP1|nr:uncharacterized protein M406DRAFT_358650 [Cryphonectria parasitica EP155]KAF3759918.1 hypothetical protein M406DRAFT_358650 [Cryphonectria parasitica EP155]
MDSFSLADLQAVGQQSMLFGTYPQQPSSSSTSTLKRQQTYPTNFSVPVYNSIEDWSAAELTTDSAPSPGSGSPISPIFNGFSFSNSGAGEDWAAWDKAEQSPESDLFLKTELLDSPDLSSIPIVSPVLDSMDVGNTGLDDVVFGREGVNDTRPLFQTPQFNNLNMPQQQQRQQQQQPQSSSSMNNSGLPSPQELSSAKDRRYPARNGLKRKSSDACSSSASPSSPRSSCSPPPPQRRHTSASSSKEGSSTRPTLGPKKTAHNMIEKRYRTNLNDKIAALRDSVPALRVMVHRLEHADNTNDGTDVMDEIKAEAGLDGDEDLGGVTPAHKLNKATILSKATEYIAHLERKNRGLAKENAALRNRVEGFEMLVMSRSGQRSVWN